VCVSVFVCVCARERERERLHECVCAHAFTIAWTCVCLELLSVYVCSTHFFSLLENTLSKLDYIMIKLINKDA